MFENNTQLPIYILPLAIVLASIVLGWIAEKVIIRQLMRTNLLISSLKGMIFITAVLAGVYAALINLQIRFSIMHVIHALFSSILILMLTIIAARIIVGFVTEGGAKVDKIFPASSILKNIIRIVVFLVGGLLILNNLNISITPILTALGVGGLAVALALQPTLSNLFSGIQIIASKQLLPGQYISLSSGEEGYVEDITWRHTAIRTMTNNTYIIPNSKISEAIITNYYQPTKDTAFIIPVRVAFNSDLEAVEKIILDVADKVRRALPGAHKDFTPLVRFAKFGEAGIELNVILKVNEFNDQFLIRHELIKELNRVFREKGIEVPYAVIARAK
jgi:small-conductance mechanosensitive channel